MKRTLLHFWRLLTEPDQSLMDGTGRWRVRYKPQGEWPQISRRMTYRQACTYADLFDGKVERA